ncbi:MARVEL domain-containing protein 3 isoform X2 [Polypterus senegalus]|uniref:MARVEL domain-containing protein 3 isoform X2 n=1 Tax=Polypterus senegalus TaxID=55291 RepID=UPI0019663074|nr:MARVEL domain-containing protein 3 isoform X2 [Polypterus senegalus]
MSERVRSSEHDSYRPRSRERDPERGRNTQSQHSRDSSGGRRNRDRHRPDERHNREDPRSGHSAERERERRYRHERDTSGSRYKSREEDKAPYPEEPPRYKDLHLNRAEPRHYAEKYSDAPVFSTSASHEYPQEEMEYYEPQSSMNLFNCYKCGYFCTGRGALQLLEVLLNILVLVCVVSSFVSLSGFSSASAGFAGGSLSLDTMSYPFQGTELQLVRDLDQKFSIERAPLLYGSLAVSLGLGALTLGIMIGNARLHSRFWILLEIIFSIIAAAAYLAGTAVYLHFVLQINRTDLCKQRAQLYARNGFTWMNCEVSGTDGAAAFFGLVLVVFYTASTVLAALQWKRIERLDE